MLEALKKILEGALEKLGNYVNIILPSLLAALVLLLGAWLIAVCTRWLLYHLFKGPAFDRFLRTSGLAFMLDPRGHLRATRLVAEAAYWCILLSGMMLGLSAFESPLTTLIIHNLVILAPKLVLAGMILLVGFWLSQYLGRTVLVWAVNEGLPSARRIATAARILIMFVDVVVAANQLDFASTVFLAAFIILVGGAVLAVSIAAGIGASDRLRRYFEKKDKHTEGVREPSLWSHF